MVGRLLRGRGVKTSVVDWNRLVSTANSGRVAASSISTAADSTVICRRSLVTPLVVRLLVRLRCREGSSRLGKSVARADLTRRLRLRSPGGWFS